MDKNNTIANRMTQIEARVGITRDGAKNGNGIIGKVDDLEKDFKALDAKMDALADGQKSLMHKLDMFDIEIKKFNNFVNDINREMKDNISFKTIVTTKNIIIGTAGFLAAVATIGAIIYKVYSIFNK